MTRPTITLEGQKARKAILEGVNAIYHPVRKTFGPEPKKALIFRTFNRGSRIVDDGHFVAEAQEPKNPHVRLAAAAFKEACKRTNERVGDGTAGTAIVAGKLFNDMYRLVSEGASSFTASESGKIGVSTVRRKILQIAKDVKEAILAAAKPVTSFEQLEQIAAVSLGRADLGKIIANMAWEVGVDGFIDVVEGFKGETETEIIKGFRFPAKVPAKAFVNNPARYEMVANDAKVLITNYALDNAAEFASTFQALHKITSKLIVLAPAFSTNALINMAEATKQGFFIYPVHVPSLRTEQFEDLSIYCGAIFIDKAKGKTMKNVTANDLGFLEKLVVKDTEAREDAVAIGGAGTHEATITVAEDVAVQSKESSIVNGKIVKKPVSKIQRQYKEVTSTAVAERIRVLKGQLEETQGESFKKLLERRIASMSSAVGTIRVADSTQASSLDLKLKVEDTVYACKAALRGGYVKGGGLCLKEIAEEMEEDNLLRSALLAPYEQIQSSIDGGIAIGKDIIDPAESIYYAVEHATGVVANLITVDTITVEEDEYMGGDGEFAIARALGELVINDKIFKGQMKEGEREMERDRMNGLTFDEIQTLDQG